MAPSVDGCATCPFNRINWELSNADGDIAKNTQEEMTFILQAAYLRRGFT